MFIENLNEISNLFTTNKKDNTFKKQQSELPIDPTSEDYIFQLDFDKS